MKWRIENEPSHKVGDTRDRVKFAWLPIACEDGFARWLCRVRVFEELRHGRVVEFPYPPWETYREQWAIKAALPLDAQFVKMPRAGNPPPVGTRQKPGWEPPKPDPDLKDWHPLHNPK